MSKNIKEDKKNQYEKGENMFKKISLVTFIASLFMLLSLSVSASEYKNEVGVGLVYGKTSRDSLNVSAASGLNIYNAKTGDVLYTSAPGEEVYILMGSTGFASIDKFDASGIPEISAQPIEGGIVKCDGKEYRGYIYAKRISNGELLIINYVGTDDYVSSVLGREMSYSWPNEALKAQAVCARNFVLCRGSAHKNYGFDVCTTTHCQVYGGVASEHENTRRAVEETKGILATHNGQIVSLYFFATSGGQTEDVENVWGSPYPYLKSVEDPYENPEKASKYRWTVTMSRSDIEKRLKSYGMDVGTLQSITVDSTTDSGRVTKMTFHGTSGSKSAKLEKCRTVLGLWSQKFTVSPDKTSVIVTTAGAAGAPLYACTGDGIKAVAGYVTQGQDGGTGYVNISDSGAENYIIEGGGYGHGVGMSQWGARGMAENGFTYDQILKHYFTDIELG